MAEPILENCEGITHLIAKADTEIHKGDLVGYSSGWVRANSYAVPGGSVTATIPAQYIAMESISPVEADGAKTIQVCKRCTLYDADTPFTAADYPLYLYGAATATGAYTETRNTVIGYLVQVVGRSISTVRAVLAIGTIREWESFITPDTFDTSAAPGLGKADAGWVGPAYAAQDDVYFKSRLPSNLVGDVAEASVIMDSNNISVGDIDVSIVAAFDGPAAAAVSNVEDTGTAISTGDYLQTDADNKIMVMDVSTCFDSGLWFPERNFCLLFSTQTPGGGEAIVIGLQLRGWVIDPA